VAKEELHKCKIEIGAIGKNRKGSIAKSWAGIY
jgi:hypothetical protein